MVITKVTKVWFDIDAINRDVLAAIFTEYGAPAPGEWSTGGWLDHIRANHPSAWRLGCSDLIDEEVPPELEREITYEFDPRML
jgi:hypothetical protein